MLKSVQWKLQNKLMQRMLAACKKSSNMMKAGNSMILQHICLTLTKQSCQSKLCCNCTEPSELSTHTHRAISEPLAPLSRLGPNVYDLRHTLLHEKTMHVFKFRAIATNYCMLSGFLTSTLCKNSTSGNCHQCHALQQSDMATWLCKQ